MKVVWREVGLQFNTGHIWTVEVGIRRGYRWGRWGWGDNMVGHKVGMRWRKVWMRWGLDGGR